MKIYVIAGNHNEAYEYINRRLEERIANGETVSKIGDYVYVDSIIRIKGISNPHGVFIGTWINRPDILDIVETLYHSNTQVNTSLHRVLVQVRKAKRKHNKLSPFVSNQAINDAADLLAREIDKEILNKINGGNI